MLLTSRMLDLTGQEFGRLVAIEPAGRDSQGHVLWNCRCQCGNFVVVLTSHLRGGSTRSCGCLAKEAQIVCLGMRTTHGHTKHASEYRIWTQMKYRCSNPNASEWEYYGGRGITVCDRWLYTYENFITDITMEIGRRPSREFTLDRINNDGNYEPGNVRWATKRQQSENQRMNRRNTSGVTGVSRDRTVWCARIKTNNRSYYLGSFQNFDDAVAARKAAEQKYRAAA